jgi:SAM-dependent methyltransferase
VSSADAAGAVRAYFDAQAAGYSGQSARGAWAMIRRAEARAVLDTGGPLDGKSFLDAGCGAGFYSGLARAAGAKEVWGVDFSDAMVASYREAGFEGRVGDLGDFDLGRRFEVVLCAGALEFVPDPARVFERLKAHLEPQGRLVILAPRRCLAGRLYRRFHRGHGVEARLFSPQDLDALAERAGLKRLGAWRKPWFALVGAFEVSC